MQYSFNNHGEINNVYYFHLTSDNSIDQDEFYDVFAYVKDKKTVHKVDRYCYDMVKLYTFIKEKGKCIPSISSIVCKEDTLELIYLLIKNNVYLDGYGVITDVIVGNVTMVSFRNLNN